MASTSDSLNTELLKEILKSLQSIEQRGANLERELQEMRVEMREALVTSAWNPNRIERGDSRDSDSAISPSKPSGMNDAMRSLSLGAGGQGDREMENQLAQELRRIEQQYLQTVLTADQKRKPELVNHLKDRLILPALQDRLSDISYMGSAYEFTTVPGKSDYDLQFFIKIPQVKENHVKTSAALANGCGDPAWRKVQGGPPDLLESDGHLSTVKARKLITSEIDKAIDKAVKAKDSTLVFAGFPVIIRRSTSGPATTLNVRWKGEDVSIDVVVCLKAEDVKNSGGHDLVAKPYEGDSKPGYWRLSYSKKELEKLRSFHRITPRKLTLLRIMKVIKQHQSQLHLFPSYFYKNILFMLDEKKGAPSDWERADLAQRFKDMIQLIQKVLEEKKLLLHFNKSVNYLSKMDDRKLSNVANYLKEIITKNKYLELFRSVPSRAGADL